MNNTKENPLPKWFNGARYPNGGVVTNRFSGDSIELTSDQLSMYDFIMGSVMLGKYDAQFNKAMNWFRRANPEAYMVLLD
jgi:hypothetical protein